MEVVTSFRTLMMYAKELGDAKKSGDQKKIAVAQEKHDAYRDMCIKSDRIMLHVRNCDLG